MIIEINGDNYKLEYNNWSFMVLERDYGFNITHNEIFREKEGEMSFSFAFKFILLGLIENHHKEEDLEQLLKEQGMGILSEEVMKKCYEAFKKSLPKEQLGKEGKKEKGK